MSESKLKILTEVLKQKKAEIAPAMDDDEFFNLFSSEQVLRMFYINMRVPIDYNEMVISNR